MDKTKPLTLLDYVNRDIKELVNHPDFNQHALRVAVTLSMCTSSELEQIDVSQFPRTKEQNHAR